MNYLSGMGECWNGAVSGVRRLIAPMMPIVAIIILSACDAPASDLAINLDDQTRVYKLDYLVTAQPALGGVMVELELRQSRRLLRELDMRLAEIDASSIVADESKRGWRSAGVASTRQWRRITMVRARESSALGRCVRRLYEFVMGGVSW